MKTSSSHLWNASAWMLSLFEWEMNRRGKAAPLKRLARAAAAYAHGQALALIVVLSTYWIVAILGPAFPYLGDVLKDHIGAIVGLPASAAGSFILVVLLRQTVGPIEFEGFGLKLTGAAGAVVIWVVCFLALAGARRRYRHHHLGPPLRHPRVMEARMRRHRPYGSGQEGLTLFSKYKLELITRNQIACSETLAWLL
jgi:hypothetical protein